MDSVYRLFNRQKSVHQILGGGFVADIMLWKQKNVTAGILFGTLAAWVMFERSGYSLLSFISSVLLLLILILFLWAKSAALLNRPTPPLPDLYVSEETATQVATFIRIRFNWLLAVSRDIVMGKDSRSFFKVAVSLFFISVIGAFIDFLTLCYTSLVILLTIPSLYNKYEDRIDEYVISSYIKLQHFYLKIDVENVSKVKSWILENRKLN